MSGTVRLLAGGARGTTRGVVAVAGAGGEVSVAAQRNDVYMNAAESAVAGGGRGQDAPGLLLVAVQRLQLAAAVEVAAQLTPPTGDDRRRQAGTFDIDDFPFGRFPGRGALVNGVRQLSQHLIDALRPFPLLADDVAAILADIAVGEPLNGMVEIAGPEPIRMDDLVRRYLTATRDARTVITDPKARYYGIEVNDQSLTPDDNSRIGPTRFEEWLRRSVR